MAVPIPISFSVQKPAAEKPLGVQELLNLIGDSLSASFDPNGYILGQLGGILPTRNYGPWANGNEWWFWDRNTGAYVRGTDGVPVGTVMIWGGQGSPTNWLSCDGSEQSRTNYQKLFHAIGTTWGAGDGTTTFNLPPGAAFYVSALNPGQPFSRGNTGGTQVAPLLVTNQLPALQVKIGFTAVAKQQPGPYGLPILNPPGQQNVQIYPYSVLAPQGTPLNPFDQTQFSIMPPFASANFMIKYQ
jgi:microcystin-dependent protein